MDEKAEYNDNQKESEKHKQRLEELGLSDEGPYAFGRIVPSCLQCVNKLAVFSFSLAVMCVFQGATVNGFVNISISTLEKRFGFESWMTGLMAVSYDIGFVLISFYVTHVLVKGHIPRVITIGFFTLGCGSVLFALPHFLTGDYEYSSGDIKDLCDDPEDCVESESKLAGYIAMFIFAQILHGFGCTPLYTIGFSYVEDSTTAENAGLHFAFILAGSCLGPAIGYVFGAAQLTVWVDAPAVVPDIDNTNPQWVGAWWIGMLACGIGSILCSLPMFGFPKQFPGVAEIKAQKKSESIEATDLGEDASLFQGVKSLLWNPVFLWASLGSALDGYLSSTLMTFGPKMYEIWFRRTAGQAALEAGIACVPGAMLGSFIGGVIVKVFKLNGRQMMYASSLCAVMVFGFYTAAMQFRCQETNITGVFSPYPGMEEPTLELDEIPCLSDCACNTEYYDPVCLDGKTYFSPCFAGCTQSTFNENFTSCACSESGDLDLIAVKGTCATSEDEKEICDGQARLFLILTFFTVMFEFMPPTLVPIGTLRAVDPNLKGLSMGLQWVILRIFGSIPGPIVLGKLMDMACLVWQEDDCDEQGSCWIYDNRLLWNAMFILPIAMKGINIFCFFLAGYYYKPKVSENESEKFDSIKSSGEGTGREQIEEVVELLPT